MLEPFGTGNALSNDAVWAGFVVIGAETVQPDELAGFMDAIGDAIIWGAADMTDGE